FIAKLAVKVAQRGVIVHRIALDALDGLIGLGAQVQQCEIFTTGRPPQMLLYMNLVGGVYGRVHDQAGGVARIAGPEKGQNQVRTFLCAPYRQGLAEILAMSGNADFAGWIPESGDSNGGVDRQPPDGLAGAAEFAL